MSEVTGDECRPPTSTVPPEKTPMSAFTELEAPAFVYSGKEEGAVVVSGVRFRYHERQIDLVPEDRRRHLHRQHGRSTIIVRRRRAGLAIDSNLLSHWFITLNLDYSGFQEPSHAAAIRHHRGPDTGRSFDLNDGQTLMVGRGQASDTRINDPRISRIHCHIQVDGGKATIVDAGSVGGTAVNGQSIKQHELSPGDVIEIGDTKLRFERIRCVDPREPKSQFFGRPKPQPKIAPLKSLVGQSLSHYRIDAVIAEGNSGTVFKVTVKQNCSWLESRFW